MPSSRSKLCAASAIVPLSALVAPAAEAGKPERVPLEPHEAWDHGGRMRSARMFATAVLAAVLVAGCGGDDGARTENARPDSGAATLDSAFLARAEAICKDANQKETAVGATGIDWIHSDLVHDEAFLEKFTAVGRSALSELSELTPPEADREQFASALAAIDKMLRGLEMQIAGLRAGKDPGSGIGTYERGYTDLVAAGGPIGFTECLDIVL